MANALNLTMKINMRSTLLLFIWGLIAFSVKAQSDAEFKHTLSIGAGTPNLPVLFFNIYDSKDNFKTEGKGPYHLKYENRINNFLSLGLNINAMSYHVSYTENVLDTVKGVIMPNNIDIRGNNTAFNVRGNLHIINPEKNDKLDVYLGIGLGLRFGKLKVSSQYESFTPSIKLPSINHIGLESTIGMRYFLADNIGVYAEFGPAKSLIQGGLSIRF